eukprot:7379094-Lingulodinium_polyedra.AAC.1
MAFNLPYGPWGGSSWYQKMVEGAADLLAHTPASDPLFEAFYPGLCRDAKANPSGDPAHKLQMLSELCQHKAFLAKGPRTAKRR